MYEMKFYSVFKSIQDAIRSKKSVVALESAVITHGLPEPINYELAMAMEEIVRSNGGFPATIAIMDGLVKIGLSAEEIYGLAHSKKAIKVSPRNLAIALQKKLDGGTTVAQTIQSASQVGINVFATGGIGGVHKNSNFDISADLRILGQTKMVVVCAGAKAILDIPATLEVLETNGVPVIGFQTSEFPAFYSRSSGLPVDSYVSSVSEVCELIKIHWQSGNKSSILIAVPIPMEFELEPKIIASALEQALHDAEINKVQGSNSTPYLLKKMSEYTQGKTLLSNLALLKNNAKIATGIAAGLANQE
jgi:pseudouridylate synthase